MPFLSLSIMRSLLLLHPFPFLSSSSPLHRLSPIQHSFPFYSSKFPPGLLRRPYTPQGFRPFCSLHRRVHEDSRPHVEDSQCLPSGQIHVIVGPMFAGKTTALLRRVQAEIDSGRNVAIIKSDKDMRYGLDSIVTHDGRKMPCFPLSQLSLFRDRFGLEAYNKLDVIGIDEAQFFEDLYDFCRNAADSDGKTVIVAGLDGDYLRYSLCNGFSLSRRKFGSVLDIVPLADSVTKLTARCGLCGHRAFFTLRKSSETQTELIGGSDVYMPVCRQHYVDGQIVVEATRIVLDVERSAVVGALK